MEVKAYIDIIFDTENSNTSGSKLAVESCQDNLIISLPYGNRDITIKSEDILRLIRILDL